MSRILGNNPQIFLCSNVTGGKTSITDQVAVNLLLNNISATGWSSTAVSALNSSNLVVSMAANKSLIVSYNQTLAYNTTDSVPGPVPNVNITSNNTSGSDYMYYNHTASDILVQECFSYQSIPSAIQSTPVLGYTLTLAEQPVDQVSSNGLNYLRVLNATNQLSTGFSINYSGANVTNSLGVEGKVFYWNGNPPTGFAPSYQNISNYVPMSSQNISLSFNDIGDNTYTGANGTYNMVQLNWDSPVFNPTAASANSANFTGVVNVVSNAPALTSLTSYSNADATYVEFTGSSNYTGTMGSAINTVGTSSLFVNLTNSNFTQALTRNFGYTLMDVAPGYTGIPSFTTLSQMQQAYGNNVTVTYYAGTFMLLDQGQPNPPIVNPVNTTAIQVVDAPSNMPTYGDNLTICFNSSQRTSLSLNGNVTSTIVYQYDFNSSPTFNTSLLGSQLTNSVVTYNATTLAKWTRSYNGVSPILPQDAVTGALVLPAAQNSLGFVLTPDNNLSGLYLTNVSVNANTDMIGYINPSGVYNITLPVTLNTSYLPYLLYNGTYYPYLNATQSIYNNVTASSYSVGPNNTGLYMDQSINQGKVGYGVINGSIGSEFLANNAAGGMRFLFEPVEAIAQIDIGQNATYDESNVTGTTPQLLWSDNVTNTVAFGPTYIGSGPVTYENFPSEYDYVQSYELVFPEEYELRNGNLRPQVLLVNGVDALGSDVKLSSNVQKSTTLSNLNFSGFCVASCGPVTASQNTLNITTSVIIPVCLSGMKGGLVTSTPAATNTVNFVIPIAYDVIVDGGEYTYGPGGKPTYKFWYKFPSTRTHTLTFQGYGVGDTSYSNLAQVLPSVTAQPVSWNVDLRQSSDILFFRRYDGAMVDYNVNICLYPQTQTTGVSYDIYNVFYTFPVATSGSADWSGVIADVHGNNAQYLQGLSLANLSGFFANGSISANPLVKSVNIFDSLVGNTNTVNLVYSSGSQGFNVTIVYPNVTQYNGRTYFATMADHLMTLQSTGSNVNPPQNSNVTGGQMLFSTVNGPYLLDSGVYMNGAANYTASNVGTQAFNLTLLKDQYWAIAYPGQNTTTNTYNVTGFIPDLINNVSSALVPTVIYDNNNNVTGNTAGLNTLMVRGYPTTCYAYDRTSTTATATWGDLSQTITLDPPAPNSSALLQFDYALGLNMDFNITIAPASYTFTNISSAFTVAKTSVSSLSYYNATGGVQNYTGTSYNDLNNTGTVLMDMVPVNALSNVPWLDLVGLNNIYYPNLTGMSVTVAYNQSTVRTSIAPFNCTVQNCTASTYVQTAPFNTTASYTDLQLYNSSTPYTITQNNAVMAFSPNYILRNASGAFYVDIAPIDVTFQWRNSTGVNGAVGTTTNYALLYNSSSLYNLTADNISCAYQLNAPSLQLFRNSVRTSGSQNISGNWIYNPNLVTLKGVQPDSNSVFNVTTIYFSNQYLNAPTATGYGLVWNTTSTFPGVPAPSFSPQYMVSFRQSGTTASSGDEVALVFSSNNMLPTWANGTYQYNNVSLCVAPDQQVVMNHYDLAWNMNPTTLVLEPTVYKYNSQPSNLNYFGTTGAAFNIYDGNSIGYVNDVDILNVSQLAVNATFTSVLSNLAIKYPYLAIDEVYYPATNTNNIANVSFTSFNQTSLFNITANSDFSYKVVNSAGRDLWEQYFIVPADNFTDAKVVNLFNKDQLVVVGPGSGNDRALMMRVGPDGVLYAPDVSSYGYLATNIPGNAAIQYDGVNSQLINSNVNLGTF